MLEKFCKEFLEILENLSLLLENLETHEKIYVNVLLILLSLVLMKILARKLLYFQMQAYGRDWGRPLLGGGSVKIGGGEGNCPISSCLIRPSCNGKC